MIRSEIGLGKSQILVWNRVRVSGSVPHTPTQFFGSTPQGFFVAFYIQMEGSLCQAFLAETVETGTKMGDRSKACFAKKALERLNLELFRNMSVHEFYRLKALITLEQVNTTEWSKKKIRILISKIAMVGCCKLSLYANESCDEHAIYFRRWLKWRAM